METSRVYSLSSPTLLESETFVRLHFSCVPPALQALVNVPYHLLSLQVNCDVGTGKL